MSTSRVKENLENNILETELHIDSCEGMIHAVVDRIPSLKMTIMLESGGKYKQFKKEYEEMKDEEAERIQSEDSEGSVEQELPKGGDSDQSLILQKPLRFQSITDSSIRNIPNYQVQFEIDISFEQSIILKKYYHKNIFGISRQNNTEIMVIPSKVRFMSKLPAYLEQALQDVTEIRNHIKISQIHKYGEEISNSQFYLNKLKPVVLEQILGKYYIWYDNNFIPDQDVKTLKREIFDQMVHRFYEFSSLTISNANKNNDDTLKSVDQTKNFQKNKQIQSIQNKRHKRVKFSVIEQQFLALKGELFAKDFSYKMNTVAKDQHCIEKSKDGYSLLIHCDVNEQLLMRHMQLDQQYRNYDFFFIKCGRNKDEKINQKAESGGQIVGNQVKFLSENLSKIKQFTVTARDNLIWIAIKESYLKDTNNLSVFAKLLEQVQFNFWIGYLYYKDQCPEQSKFELIFPQYGPKWYVEVRMKEPSSKGYQEFFKKFIAEGRKDTVSESSSKNNKSYIPVLNEDQELSFSDRFNLTDAINDSTQLQHTNLDQSEIHNHSLNSLSSLLGPLGVNMIPTHQLTDYKILIVDQKEATRHTYSSELSQIELSNKKQKELQCQLRQLTNGTVYKVYSIRLPMKLKVDLPAEDLVTVFVRAKQMKERIEKQLKGKQDKQQNVRAFFLNDPKNTKGNGYLVNSTKSTIIDKAGGLLQLPVGSYEITKYLKIIQA